MIGRGPHPNPNPPPLAEEGAGGATLKPFQDCRVGLFKPPRQFAPSPAGGGGVGWGLFS